VSKTVKENMPLPDYVTCPCQNNNLISPCDDLVEGHIVSCDPQLIKDNRIRELFEYGFKFRQNLSLESIMESLKLGLQNFVEEASRGCCDWTFIHKLRCWKDKVIQRCQENLNHYLKSHPGIASEKLPFGTAAAIKRFKDIFVICPVDKTQHNMGFVCKHWYLHTLSLELGSPAYEIVQDKTVEDILKYHSEWNKNHGHEDEHVDNLSYLYGSIKFHKDPPTMRFLAGVSANRKDSKIQENQNVFNIYHRPLHQALNSTTAASKYLSKQLQTVMRVLHKKDKEFFMHMAFIAAGSLEVPRKFFMKSKPI
jgi:hypothetical protein